MALVMTLGAFFAAPPAHARPAQTTATPDLCGRWRLDHARSDDPQKKLQDAMANAHRGPMGGGPPDGMPPGGGPGGGMPPGGDMPGDDMPGGPAGEDGTDGASTSAKGAHAARTLESFTLEQAGDTLAFLDHGLRVRLVIVNGGRPLPGCTRDGIEQASGQWKKTRLIAQGTGPGREMNSETWELLDQGQTLRCTTRVRLPGGRGSMGTLEIALLYARVAVSRPAHPSPNAGTTTP